MSRPFPSRFQRRSSNAFSLVEVVLAIGVTSFALLGMVALLPIGLSTANQAADATVQSQIVQYSRNQMEMTTFTNLATSWNGVKAYFDNQGLPTTNNDPEAIYTVTYAVTNLGMYSTNGAGSYYFGDANSSTTNAATVLVLIAPKNRGGAIATNAILVPNAGF